jgi:hypothetical protein
MAEQFWTKETLWAELEALGEDEVRVRLATKFYTDVNERGGLAREWLQRRELARAAESERRKDAFQAEQAATASRALEAASRAADAADRQARTAEKAARTAIAALVVAIIAIIVSLFALKH